jgi:hypothetical protein
LHVYLTYYVVKRKSKNCPRPRDVQPPAPGRVWGSRVLAGFITTTGARPDADAPPINRHSFAVLTSTRDSRTSWPCRRPSDATKRTPAERDSQFLAEPEVSQDDEHDDHDSDDVEDIVHVVPCPILLFC